jgi:hypothetical protein
MHSPTMIRIDESSVKNHTEEPKLQPWPIDTPERSVQILELLQFSTPRTPSFRLHQNVIVLLRRRVSP